MAQAKELPSMADLNDRDQAVLGVLAEGRANPLLIREETDMAKGDVNSVLVKLTRDGLAKRVTTGLYEITADGREVLNEILEGDGERG